MKIFKSLLLLCLVSLIFTTCKKNIVNTPPNQTLNLPTPNKGDDFFIEVNTLCYKITFAKKLANYFF